MGVKTKIALVTGGSRGLGKNTALALAKKGINVILTYNSNKDEALQVVEEIKQLGRNAAALQFNAGELETFDQFIAHVQETLKHTFGTDNFDFLINNAGTALYASFAETTEAQLDIVWNIHYKGVFFLTQKALPIINDFGRIINISSILTRSSYPGSSAYASMKGAIEILTNYLAKELGERRISANVVAPGAIETDFGGGHIRDNQEINSSIANLTALGRVAK